MANCRAGIEAPSTPRLALLTGGPRGPPVNNYMLEHSGHWRAGLGLGT